MSTINAFMNFENITPDKYNSDLPLQNIQLHSYQKINFIAKIAKKWQAVHNN